MKRDHLYEPFSINIETLDTYPQKKEEQHHFFELIYILTGKGRLHINQSKFSYLRGQLFLTTPKDAHFFEIEKNTVFCFLRFNNIYIESDAFCTDNIERLEFILENSNCKPNLILTDKTDRNLVRVMIKAIMREQKENEEELYNKELVHQLANTLIFIVARNIAQNLSKNITERTDDKIIEILNYIQANIYTPKKIRIETISKHFNISRNYLGRYFKHHCKETLQAHITNCKIALIENRLRHSDKRINEIVEEFGFTDESHLNKFFKQQHGVSPSVYRRTIKETSKQHSLANTDLVL